MPVEVRFSRARRTVLRVEKHGETLRVHMHSFFAHAPLDVQEHVLAWLRSGRRARRATSQLDQWIETELAQLWQREPRLVRLRTRGQAHDLEPLATELFGGPLRSDFSDPAARPRVTWGRSTKSRTRRTLRLGSYDYHSGLVRIHPVLDQEAVPSFFVRYVLHHELLHAALPREGGHGTRRVFHGPEFRRRERAFDDTQRALEWEKHHLEELLRSARTGKEMRVTAAARATRPRKRAPNALVRGARWVQRVLF